MRHFTPLFAAFALMLAAVAASATDLDSDVIDRWANSMDEIEVWAQENEMSDADMTDPDDPTNLEASMSMAVSQNPGMQDIIEDHGFNDGDTWASTGARIVNAYGAVVMEEDPQAGSYEEMQQQMQAQLEQLESDPNINEQQLEMIREQASGAMAMMERMASAPEADKDVVRNNRGRLDQLFEQ